MSIEILAKQGRGRIYGGLAAVETNKLRQMRNNSMRSCFQHFDEAKDRMEYVARIHGKEFINDASATTVNAAWYALKNTEGHLIWIAQGNDSECDYAMLRPLALRKVMMLICVGKDNSNLHNSFQGLVPEIVDVETIGEAVNRACYCNIDMAKVIYSPATSTGINNLQAGTDFRHEVNEL